MLGLGKKMLCVYGLKPNQSNREVWSSDPRMATANLIEVGKKVTVCVRLFPRESQPSSSTRWWTVSLKGRGVFRKNKHCKITERVGTRTFTTEGKFSVDGVYVVVAGQLEDDSVCGRYFLLRLKQEESSVDGVLYEGTLARSKSSCVESSSWEVTHDAMIFRDKFS